jgi:acetyl-CoA acetyltransferase
LRDDDVAIVGVGEARIGRDAGCSSWELHLEAISAALDDAGLGFDDIDGLISCPSTIDDHARHHVLLAEQLGLPLKRYTDSSRVGGASSTSAVRDAAAVIRSGAAEVVVISSADTQRNTVGRADTPVIKMAHYHSADYEIPYGPLIISLYALIAQRWMHEYGWTAEDFAEVAVSQRFNASLHPGAQERELITVEDVLASKMISDPLHMLDCSLISDGGAAMIVTTAERAARLATRPVYIRGIGNTYSYYYCWDLPNYTDYFRSMISASADMAYAQADITPADIDLAFVGDPAAPCTLIGLEGLGFAKPGGAPAWAAGGAIRVGGRLPVNTHGGCLSYAHPGAPGQHLHMIEAVRQLRGECDGRQVAGARYAAVHGLAGVITSHCTLILDNEPSAH